MPNVTISIDEKTLEASRTYAKRHNMSLNGLIRKMLEQCVHRDSIDWLDECFAKMDMAQGDSKGKRWTRDELYDI
ncbi:MAG: hypothetical protein QNJ97_13155 [Myxococcota bacterium]|nr:hypothetical protein [Myxococcota bacterium]